MDKSTLLIAGIVIILGMGFVFYGQIVDAIGIGNETETSTKNEPEPLGSNASDEAKKLEALIEKLKAQSWDKNEYENFLSKITNSRGNELISSQEEKILLDKLDNAYIITLNNAAKAFFKSSKKSSELKPINVELKRYMKTKHEGKVKEMRTAASNFYQLIELTKDVSNFVSSDIYDEQKSTDYFKKLTKFKEKKYLAQSSIVANRVSKSRKSLRTKLADIKIMKVESSVRTYWRTAEYNSDLTSSFLDEITKMETNSYLKDDTRVSTFCNEVKENLDAHKRKQERYRSLMRKIESGESSCIDEFGGFGFYLSRCKQGSEIQPDSIPNNTEY